MASLLAKQFLVWLECSVRVRVECVCVCVCVCVECVCMLCISYTNYKILLYLINYI